MAEDKTKQENQQRTEQDKVDKETVPHDEKSITLSNCLLQSENKTSEIVHEESESQTQDITQ